MSRELCMKCMNEYETRNGAAAVCPVCGTPGGTGALSAAHLIPKTILNDKYVVGLALGGDECSLLYIGGDLDTSRKLLIREFYPAGLCFRNNAEGNQVKFDQDKNYERFQKGMNRFGRDGKVMMEISGGAGGFPGLLPVRDVFRKNGTAYFIMDYLPGVPLSEYMKSGSRFSINEVISLMMPVLDILDRLHNVYGPNEKGIWHLNLTPDNIFILESGEVLLSDIGRYRLGLERETGKYQAMEIYEGGKAGPESDVYSICAIMYELLTGRAPTGGEERLRKDTLPEPVDLNIHLSKNQNNLIMNGLEPYPENRTKSIAALMREITTIRPVVRMAESADTLSAGRTAAPWNAEETVNSWKETGEADSQSGGEDTASPRGKKGLFFLVAVIIILTIIIIYGLFR